MMCWPAASSYCAVERGLDREFESKFLRRSSNRFSSGVEIRRHRAPFVVRGHLLGRWQAKTGSGRPVSVKQFSFLCVCHGRFSCYTAASRSREDLVLMWHLCYPRSRFVKSWSHRLGYWFCLVPDQEHPTSFCHHRRRCSLLSTSHKFRHHWRGK